jgi:FtsH-binding integral membrane protein
MNDTLTYQRMGTTARGPTHALFAQTMGYVAATAALFALGAWLGHNLTGGVGIVAFIAAFGAAGYATRRDLTAIARVCFWALLALIVAGIVLVFVHIPGADLAYSVLGLVIFAGFTMFDFQRLRTNTEVTTAPFLAASIFLDVLNVFLFFLEIFSGGQGER